MIILQWEESDLVKICIIWFNLKIKCNQVKRHLWNPQYGLGVDPGTRDSVMNQTKIPALMKLTF